MKFLKLTICFYLLLITFSACRKDALVIDEKEKDPVPTVKIQIQTTGIVVDNLGNPIQDANVFLGSQFTQTDQNGYFKLIGLANETKGILEVSKEGYFTGYPVFYPEEGKGQQFKVELLDRVTVGIVSDNSKVVSLNQHQVDFTNATFKDINGVSYSGEVTVFAAYLDPTDDDLEDFMSGDLVGINSESEEQILTSYGMLNVELEDDGGNALTMEGEAELTMEIPNSILNQAPATIPLWYFDEAIGNWVEEGEATLVGNNYIGKVTHFTLWNCDDPRDLVTITGSIISNFDPTSFVIKVTDANGTSKTTTANEGGRFTGKVPANETLVFEILDQCGAVKVSQSIGPFSSDIFIGNFDVMDNDVSILNISGVVVDCDLNTVANGYVMVADENDHVQILDINSDGTFNHTLVWCTENTVTITSYDSDANKISEPVVLNYLETLSVGNMITCDALLAGISISGPEVNKFIPFPSNFTAPPPNSSANSFSAIDDQGNGNKIIYDLTIIDWGGGTTTPATLNATMNIPSLIGNPTDIISWSNLPDADLGSQIYSLTDGGLIDVRFIDAEVTVEDDMQNVSTHSGHTIRIVILFD